MSNTLNFTETEWVKSSYSSGEGGMCLEWAPQIANSGVVPIRDTKLPGSPELTFPAGVWRSFVTGLKHAG
ncbi:DUF397 domain-containing protein [Streptomyces sp. I05A-00742]|uniref:DUF397 domain-containing protein n=1 Tax=Streptomyces sp. I05A-00742 TaxID=2732853 RepID=UPI001489B5A7|nr:DUF397 domain-containing protein [Streptomyces sp. I05A-00742]